MIEKKPLSITFLLGSWGSASMIFLIGEAVFQSGALTGLMITTALLLAFLLNSPLLYSNSVSTCTTILKKAITYISYMGAMLLHLLIGSFILQVLVQLNVYMTLLLHLLLIFIVIQLCNNWAFLKNGVLFGNVSLLFRLAIFLPIYIYLQEGLETVYHNLLHYHPYVLHLNQQHYLRYFFICLVIFSGKFYWQLPTLKRFAGSQMGKGIRKLLVAIGIFTTLILSFSTMTIVAATQNFDLENPNAVLLYLIEKKSSSPIFHLVCMSLYGLSLLSAITVHFKKGEEDGQIRNWIPGILLIVSSLFSIVLLYKNISLLYVYVIFGLIIGITAVISFIMTGIKVIIFKKV